MTRLLLVAVAALCCSQAFGSATDDPVTESLFALHAQTSYVVQSTNRFAAPYAGPNSLTPDQSRETFDVTLYLGARLWSGAELWLNPELDQGFGLSDTTGLAGFASGEAYKVGSSSPYLRLQRAFVRQTWNRAGKTESVEAGPNLFASATANQRWVLTVGKFSVGDVFDVNRYAHDPRADFLNWAVIDAGSFDYAADAWGYTAGAALEWYRGPWTLRGGFFDVSDVPNSPKLEPGFDEFQLVFELEHRYALGGTAGKLLVTSFVTHARMALLEDAIAYGAMTGGAADPEPVRHFRERYGGSINLEQDLGAGIGMFLRAGVAAGNVETYDFTDIDHTVSAGVAISGEHWRRGQDTVGLAAVVNSISTQRRQFLDAAGLGVLVGDGRLPNAGHERIAETYYEATIIPHLQLTLDYQRAQNPAYNKDRGPASIIAVRLHAQF